MPSVMELSGYVFEPLREDLEFAMYRGRQIETCKQILVLAPVPGPYALAAMGRLKHEYSLAEQLDPAWALRPAALTHHNGRTVLVFEDPGGDPLDRMVGRPLELSRFLHVSIALVGALRQVHGRGLVHKDIKPANVLVDAMGNVRLTGFGIASRLVREHQ